MTSLAMCDDAVYPSYFGSLNIDPIVKVVCVCVCVSGVQ
jgi:hypothetical protein